jgi:hypothetical protein
MSSIPFAEEHFTASELAERWKLDPDTIRKIFRDEPGVLQFTSGKKTRYRKCYITLRIPASVAERVHRRMSVIA